MRKQKIIGIVIIIVIVLVLTLLLKLVSTKLNKFKA